MVATATTWPADRRTLGLVALSRLLEVHRDTIWRWIKYGVEPPGGGERVRLSAVRVGRVYRVCEADLIAFQACCAGELPPEVPSPLEVDREAREAQQRVAARLGRKRTG